jgi:hypothetical protein
MHFLCIPFFLFTYYVYVCALFYFFLDWSTFFHILFCSCSYVHLPFQFNIFFVQVTKVLSIASLVAFPFQKVCGNCHVMDVIIFLNGCVHCNVSFKINGSKIRLYLWFHCNQWWTHVIDYWGQIVWNNYAYDDKIKILKFASSKTSSTRHFNWHSWKILIVTHICPCWLSKRHPTIYSTSENKLKDEGLIALLAIIPIDNVQHSLKHKPWFWWIEINFETKTFLDIEVIDSFYWPFYSYL